MSTPNNELEPGIEQSNPKAADSISMWDSVIAEAFGVSDVSGRKSDSTDDRALNRAGSHSVAFAPKDDSDSPTRPRDDHYPDKIVKLSTGDTLERIKQLGSGWDNKDILSMTNGDRLESHNQWDGHRTFNVYTGFSLFTNSGIAVTSSGLHGEGAIHVSKPDGSKEVFDPAKGPVCIEDGPNTIRISRENGITTIQYSGAENKTFEIVQGEIRLQENPRRSARDQGPTTLQPDLERSRSQAPPISEPVEEIKAGRERPRVNGSTEKGPADLLKAMFDDIINQSMKADSLKYGPYKFRDEQMNTLRSFLHGMADGDMKAMTNAFQAGTFPTRVPDAIYEALKEMGIELQIQDNTNLRHGRWGDFTVMLKADQSGAEPATLIFTNGWVNDDSKNTHTWKMEISQTFPSPLDVLKTKLQQSRAPSPPPPRNNH